MMTQALRAQVMAKRPKWCIRSAPVQPGAVGMLVASCPPGIARTPDEALDWYRRRRPHGAKWADLLAFPADD